MLFGDPNKFAFLIDRVPEWEMGGWINGIMFVIVNGEVYPKDVRTTTFGSELYSLLTDNSAFINPINDKELYGKDGPELLRHLADMTYPPNPDDDNDYRFLIPFHEINDSGYHLFILSNGDQVKILVGKWEEEKVAFVDETELSMQEYNQIKGKVMGFYHDGGF